MGRSPDYRSSFLATLGANAATTAATSTTPPPGTAKAQERTWYINRDHEPAGGPQQTTADTSDVYVHVTKGRPNAGIYVSGAKVIAPPRRR